MGLRAIIGTDGTAQSHRAFTCRAHRTTDGTSFAVRSSCDQCSIIPGNARATLTGIADGDGRRLTCFHITTRAASATLATVVASNCTQRVSTIAAIATDAANACFAQDHTGTTGGTRCAGRTAIATVTADSASDTGGTVGGCDRITALTAMTAIGTTQRSVTTVAAITAGKLEGGFAALTTIAAIATNQVGVTGRTTGCTITTVTTVAACGAITAGCRIGGATIQAVTTLSTGTTNAPLTGAG